MHKRVHITGIGGTGMSAIALILLARGYQVSGSDTQASAYLHAVRIRWRAGCCGTRASSCQSR